MTEARRPLEDADTIPHEAVIEGAGHTVDHPLIRDARRDDPYIHTSLRRETERVRHLIRDDQVRCDEVAVLLCLVRHTDVDILPDLLVIHRTVGIRLDEARRLLRGIMIALQETKRIRVVPVRRADSIPHLEEGEGHALHRRSLDADTAVLPLPVWVCHIEILIGEIIATGEADTVIDDRDFPVITIIQKEVCAWCERIKYTAVNPESLHLLHEIRRDEAYGAHIIIEHTHMDAGLHTLDEHLLDTPPGLLIFDGMVLHEDELLRLPKVAKLRFQALRGILVILDIRVPVNRVGGIILKILCDGGRCRIFLFQCFQIRRIRRILQRREQHMIDLLVTLPHLPCRHIETDEEVQDDTEHRKRHDEDDPRHLHRARLMLPVDDEHHDQCDHLRHILYPLRVPAQSRKKGDDQKNLNDQCQPDEKRPQYTVFIRCLSLFGAEIRHIFTSFQSSKTNLFLF